MTITGVEKALEGLVSSVAWSQVDVVAVFEIRAVVTDYWTKDGPRPLCQTWQMPEFRFVTTGGDKV